jgi:rubrerythrin
VTRRSPLAPKFGFLRPRKRAKENAMVAGDSEDFSAVAASLASLEKLEVAELRLMFRLETAGETFYQRLADRLGNSAAADLLRRNAREERGHAERLRRAIELKLGRPWTPEVTDLAPFAIALPDRVTGELLAGIVQGELQGDAGYQRWADAEPNPEIQKLLRQNGREETVHAMRVKEALALLGS